MKKQKGITLVALVITIIILLILASIAIGQLTNSGLFEKTKLAKDKYENARQKELNNLEEMEKLINNNGTYKKLKAEQFAFTSKDTNWNVKNVKEALDYLYNN